MVLCFRLMRAIAIAFICLRVPPIIIAAELRESRKASYSAMACLATSYIFGEPLPNTQKAVIIHKLGFSSNPYKERRFQEGSDCVCDKIPCHRRQSEFCIPKNTLDDYEARTRNSYPDMNPYTHPVGVIFPIDMGNRTESQMLSQLGLVIRTCYPWLAVLCSFYDETASFQANIDSQRYEANSSSSSLFSWLRECCDAVLLPSRRFTELNKTQIMYHKEANKIQNFVFTLASWRYTCNKCGITTALLPIHKSTPFTYQSSQKSPNGKRIPIAVRHRDAYLHIGEMKPPQYQLVNVTGGFESLVMASLAQPSVLNFTYFYMGNTTYWTSGGGTLINGTYDGMLDLLCRRTAILAISNQKPFDPADKLFTFTTTYDVDTLPFVSRIAVKSVTVKWLFRSIGNRYIYLLAASTTVFAIIVQFMFGVRKLRVENLFTFIWFFAMRLFQSGFSIAILAQVKTPPQVKWVIYLWGVLALVFSSMFNGVWVTFITTPPFKSVFDDFSRMKSYITRYNTTAYMSPGLLESAPIYGESLKAIFDHGRASTNSSYIIEQLREDKKMSFWFYEKVYLIYALSRYDPNRTLHISSDYFFIQQQCWVIQKNCALEPSISRVLNLFRESGLLLHFKKDSNILELTPRIPEDPFKPVVLTQLREVVIFVFSSPGVILFIIFIEILVYRSRRRVAPVSFDPIAIGSFWSHLWGRGV